MVYPIGPKRAGATIHGRYEVFLRTTNTLETVEVIKPSIWRLQRNNDLILGVPLEFSGSISSKLPKLRYNGKVF